MKLYPPTGGQELEDFKTAQRMLDMIRVSDEGDGDFSIPAEWLHRSLRCKMPYPLWAYQEIVKWYEPMKDYVSVVEDGKKEVSLTPDAAHLIATRQPSPVSVWMRIIIVKAINELAERPGYEYLKNPFEAMDRAQVWAAENERLEKLLDPEP